MTRLIDADALKAEWYRMNDIDENDRGVRFMGYTEITRWIDSASTIEPDGDLISRQDAIDAVCEKCQFKCTISCDNIDALKSLPSAPDSRQRGEWVLKENVFGVAYCSNCDYELHTNNTPFCPNCGADMRGENK